MKNKLVFLFKYCKMRIGVLFGFRRTSYPLSISWWWNHQGFFKLNDVYID
ncbi:MAG: hypothetical protein IPJ30_07360 [Acidobacteria bacterium]|nr:hypothetical protein [Acidobacteriota bacterium]MBK8147403.1 hypothetical protein [Acidobacteriota bacterium]